MEFAEEVQKAVEV
jgi:hypothetical protein